MPAKRLTTTVTLKLAEWERVQRLDDLTRRAVDLIGEAGEINCHEAFILIRALAADAPL